jgi:cholesterol 7-desaturase
VKFKFKLKRESRIIHILRWSADKDNKHTATVFIKHVMKLWKFEFVEMKVKVKQIGPGYVLLFAESSFGKMIFLQTLTPVEPLIQKMSHYFYAPRKLAWLAKFTILAESINVCEFLRFLNN